MMIDQQEVRWHLLPMLARLPLTGSEREQAFAFAEDCLGGSSRIVAVEALSAMFALADANAAMRDRAADAADAAADASSRLRRLCAQGRENF